MTAIIDVRSATVSFSSGLRPAVVDATLAVTAGEAIGIVGETGSGKTTLGRLMVGALWPTAGTVTVRGCAWRDVGRRDPRRREVQMIFQDSLQALNPRMTPRAAVSEVFRVVRGATRAEARTRAKETLGEVGLAGDVIDQSPRGLSGGQRQRVGIARALACDPSVIVADEPTSALDVSVQAQILSLLQELRRNRQLTLVLISHDLGVVKHATDRVLVMYRGAIVEDGDTEALMLHPQHSYTRLLVDSIPGNARTHRRPRLAAVDERIEEPPSGT